MTIAELFTKGIHSQTDGCFFRSAPVLLTDETIYKLRDYLAPTNDTDLLWVVGNAVRVRLNNRNVLGTPKAFVARGEGLIIGHIDHAPVYGVFDSDRWSSDALIAICCSGENVLRYAAFRIDIDTEH